MSERGTIEILVVSSEDSLAEEVRAAVQGLGSDSGATEGADSPGQMGGPSGPPRVGVVSVATAAQARRALGLGSPALVVVELASGDADEDLRALDLVLGSSREGLPPVLGVVEALPPGEAGRRLTERVNAVLGRPLERDTLARTISGLLNDREAGREPMAPAVPTILVVEDDPVTTELLRHRLTRDGFQVLHFGDGLDAYKAVAEQPASLALLDIKLPGMDGLELLERLRRLSAWSQVPIVMITAVAGSKDVVRAFELGANDYVVKPFSPPEVVARLRRLLA